ncbi:MAG: hypothetical protein KTR20_03140 [Cellvibrionaceae bacterium]|nr:hypothetical protein [Cellvibrionaceae bacterium]
MNFLQNLGNSLTSCVSGREETNNQIGLGDHLTRLLFNTKPTSEIEMMPLRRAPLTDQTLRSPSAEPSVNLGEVKQEEAYEFPHTIKLPQNYKPGLDPQVTIVTDCSGQTVGIVHGETLLAQLEAQARKVKHLSKQTNDHIGTLLAKSDWTEPDLEELKVKALTLANQLIRAITDFEAMANQFPSYAEAVQVAKQRKRATQIKARALLSCAAPNPAGQPVGQTLINEVNALKAADRAWQQGGDPALPAQAEAKAGATGVEAAQQTTEAKVEVTEAKVEVKEEEDKDWTIAIASPPPIQRTAKLPRAQK